MLRCCGAASAASAPSNPPRSSLSRAKIARTPHFCRSERERSPAGKDTRRGRREAAGRGERSSTGPTARPHTLAPARTHSATCCRLRWRRAHLLAVGLEALLELLARRFSVCCALLFSPRAGETHEGAGGARFSRSLPPGRSGGQNSSAGLSRAHTVRRNDGTMAVAAQRARSFPLIPPVELCFGITHSLTHCRSSP